QLTPIEEACGYQQLELLGYPPARIAKATGRSRATVDRRLALMRLPEPTRQRIHTGQISLGDAEAMLDFADQPTALAKLDKAAGTSDWTWTLAGERNRVAKAKAKTEALAGLAAAGVTAIDPPARWSWGSTEQPVANILNPDSTDPDNAAFTAETHAGCPHHAAVVAGGGHVTYACTQPTVHGHPDHGDRTAQTAAAADLADRDAQRQAEQDTEQALRADLDTARAVRHEFLTELLNPTRKPTKTHLTEMLRRILADQLEYVDARDFLPLLGHPLADDSDQVDEQMAEFTQRIPSLSLDRCVQALYATIERSALTAPSSWGQPHARDYLDHLARLGYQPTEIEQRMLVEQATDD
ncbi:MAG: hypothetical protein L0Y54_22380, partial [Sporichthyaceae bacterium]|nr:hypothetical protein [Sporichthyaceae bacterium]